MGRIRLLALSGAMVFVAACNDTSPVGPSGPAGRTGKDNGLLTNDAWFSAAGPGAVPIRIYSQNVYPGFDIDSVAVALERSLDSNDPTAFFTALAIGMATFDATNWPERAARMALEIQQQDPDVVSLNEMITLDRKGLGLLYPSALPINFPDGKTDFLGVFKQELASKGLSYKLVDSLPLTDALVDLSGQLGLPDLTVYARYQDRDALFVRQDVGVANVTADTFAVTRQQVVSQLRGWIGADLTVRGKTWHFVETHPDPSWPANGNPTHVSQLLASVANVPLPVIIAGDLNLEPTWPEHQQLIGARFVDLWTRKPGPPFGGNTCCHTDPALRNAESTLTKRIDYVMVRPAHGHAVGPVRFSLFGDDLSECTATGMWPSDHAGLLVGLVMHE